MDFSNKEEATKYYLEYVCEHIATVEKVWETFLYMNDGYSDDITVSMISNLIAQHDNSKFGLEEFGAYRRHFYPTERETQNNRSKELFMYAWNHHIHNNPHHWNHWVVGDYILEMPAQYMYEMLCDWTAMSIKFKNPPSKWFEENRSKIKLHKYTIESVERLLEKFDEVYNMLAGKESD